MFNSSKHGFCSEFYTVEKTIEVVVSISGQDQRVRIDALYDHVSGNYCTKAYIEENLTVQPTFPQSNGAYGRAPQDYQLWVGYDLPWTHRSTADDALDQALSFLEERVG